MATTDHGQATGKLYHLRLRVECTLFVIYKAWRKPMLYWWLVVGLPNNPGPSCKEILFKMKGVLHTKLMMKYSKVKRNNNPSKNGPVNMLERYAIFHMVSKPSFKDSFLKYRICMYNFLWQMEGQDESSFIINDQSIIFHLYFFMLMLILWTINYSWTLCKIHRDSWTSLK